MFKGVGLDSEKRIFNEKMRKDAKRAYIEGKMGKETIIYWKSTYDIIGVNYSVHSKSKRIYASLST